MGTEGDRSSGGKSERRQLPSRWRAPLAARRGPSPSRGVLQQLGVERSELPHQRLGRHPALGMNSSFGRGRIDRRSFRSSNDAGESGAGEVARFRFGPQLQLLPSETGRVSMLRSDPSPLDRCVQPGCFDFGFRCRVSSLARLRQVYPAPSSRARPACEGFMRRLPRCGDWHVSAAPEQRPATSSCLPGRVRTKPRRAAAPQGTSFQRLDHLELEIVTVFEGHLAADLHRLPARNSNQVARRHSARAGHLEVIGLQPQSATFPEVEPGREVWASMVSDSSRGRHGSAAMDRGLCQLTPLRVTWRALAAQ